MIRKKTTVRGCVFGPVPSRRLGRSLGVDLVPAKTCPLDCIYCEAGRTTRVATARAEFIPTTTVLAELAAVLGTQPELDYVTFSGAGEPTLHSGIGEIIRWLKQHHPEYRICLLTNGMLLPDLAVRRELAPLDLIIPSLDAADEETFRKINRPAPGLTCRELPAAYAAFRRESAAAFWLEIFVVPGINDHPAAIAALREAVAVIRPDKIQLNSLDRPGTEPWVTPATAATMDALVTALSGLAPIEVIGRVMSAGRQAVATAGDVAVRIQDLLRRRPCTVADLAVGLALPEDEIQRETAKLLADGIITASHGRRGVFFVPRSGGE